MEAQEKQALEAMIDTYNSTSDIDTSYIDNYVSAFDEIAEKSADWENYKFADEDDANRFAAINQSLSENAQLYQDGTRSAEEYFAAIEAASDKMKDGFEYLNAEIDDDTADTDLLEA
jgi:hypothetical protein